MTRSDFTFNQEQYDPAVVKPEHTKSDNMTVITEPWLMAHLHNAQLVTSQL